MSQINPREILNEGILSPSEYTEMQQVGIDLTLQEAIKIRHGQSYNALLNERVYLPENIFAIFIHRSSYNRMGVLITGSVYDPGYRGVVGCTLYNLSGETIEIAKNERIGQMIFFEAASAFKYNGQWQGEHLKK